MSMALDYVLLLFMAATAFGVLRSRNLIAVVMLSSLYSLLAASLFVVLDAPDVALTEAAVGAGAATFLMLGALAFTGRHAKPVKVRPVPLAVVILTGLILIYGTLSLPPFGDPKTPAQVHVAPRYLAEAPDATGTPNIVTAVLASYRGWDTLGEVVVILSAGVGVLMLLGVRGRRFREEEEQK
ncbi:MAG: DUF4040 domain-containing protein [Rhodospirillales bacterium]